MADLAEMRESWTPRMLSVFRIVVALLYLQHPLAKFFGFPHVAAFDNLQPFSLVWVAGHRLLLATYTSLRLIASRSVKTSAIDPRLMAQLSGRRSISPSLNDQALALSSRCDEIGRSGTKHRISIRSPSYDPLPLKEPYPKIVV